MLRRLRSRLGRSGYPPMVFLAMGGGLAYALSLTLIVTPLPRQVEALGGTLVAVGTAGTLYGLSSSLSRPVAGRLVDWWPGWIYLAGLAGLALTPLMYAFVPTLGALYVGRLFQGLALSAASTAYRTIVANLAPRERRGEAMALGGVTYPLALMIGPPVGEIALDQVGMTGTFLTSAGLAAVALAAVWPLRHLGQGRTRFRFQAGGFRDLLGRPGLQAAALSAWFTGVTWGALVAFLPLMGPRLGMERVGVLFTLFSGTLFFLRVPLGRLSDRIGRVPLLLWGGAFTAAACGAFPLVHGPAATMGLALLLGLSFAAYRSAAEALLIDDIPEEHRGTGVGLNFFGFDLGSAVGPLVVGALAELGGFDLAFPVLGILGFACLALVIWRARQASGSGDCERQGSHA